MWKRPCSSTTNTQDTRQMEKYCRDNTKRAEYAISKVRNKVFLHAYLDAWSSTMWSPLKNNVTITPDSWGTPTPGYCPDAEERCYQAFFLITEYPTLLYGRTREQCIAPNYRFTHAWIVEIDPLSSHYNPPYSNVQLMSKLAIDSTQIQQWSQSLLILLQINNNSFNNQLKFQCSGKIW